MFRLDRRQLCNEALRPVRSEPSHPAPAHLVQLEPDQTRAVLLCGVNRALQGLALGGEPEAVVNQLSVAGGQLVLCRKGGRHTTNCVRTTAVAKGCSIYLKHSAANPRHGNQSLLQRLCHTSLSSHTGYHCRHQDPSHATMRYSVHATFCEVCAWRVLRKTSARSNTSGCILCMLGLGSCSLYPVHITDNYVGRLPVDSALFKSSPLDNTLASLQWPAALPESHQPAPHRATAPLQLCA